MGSFYKIGDISYFLSNNGSKYPFHMPGHKRNAEFISPLLRENFLLSDITETEGADNLTLARCERGGGVLSRLQYKLSLMYGGHMETFLSVNGSTACVIASVLAATGVGGSIVAARNAHSSFYNALALSWAKALYVAPEASGFGFCGAVSAGAVEYALKLNPLSKAVFITSPTYEGVVSDVAAIAETAKRYGALLIVDEAHGAHFIGPAAGGCFPQSAVNLGADIVIHSLHKTLPALTQTAAVHVRSGSGDLAYNVKRALNAVTTTSPSYIMLAQAEYMADTVIERGEALFSAHMDKLKDFRAFAKRLKNITLVDGEYESDPARLVFIADDCAGIAKELDSRFGVVAEAAYKNHMICVTSIADTAEGFERLKSALSELDGKRRPPNLPLKAAVPPLIPESATTVREAYINGYERVPKGAARGRVSAALYAAYPPGVPIIAPGEIITGDLLEYIEEDYIEVLVEENRMGR